MPAINDHGIEVPVVEDFLDLDKWIAPQKHDFRKVLGTRIVNPKGLDLSGIQAYLPDTSSDFSVKNIFKEEDKGTVRQDAKGIWKGSKLDTAMEQLCLTLNLDDEDNPHLIDDDIRVVSDDGVELVFTGNWLVRGWRVDLVVNKNKNGIKEVEFFRDEIRWVRVPEGLVAPDENTETYTSTYWVPY